MASDFSFLRGILVAVVVVLILSPGISHATTSEETAKSYFEEGTELNKQQRYDEAIGKLTQAVRLSLETVLPVVQGVNNPEDRIGVVAVGRDDVGTGGVDEHGTFAAG